MVVFFLSVALTNLALGYALALYLHPHAGNDDLPVPSLHTGARMAPVSDSHVGLHIPPALEVELAKHAPPASAPASDVAAMIGEEPVDDPAIPAPAKATTHHVQATEFAPPTEPQTSAEPVVALQAHSPAELPGSELTEAAMSANTEPTLERDEVRRSIDQFKLRLQDYRAKLTEIDQRVHACVEEPDAGQVQGCLRDLRTMNYDYFEHQLEISEQVAKSTSEADAVGRTHISAAVDVQSAQISDVDCALVELDPAADASGCAQQLLGETAKLLRASETFSQALSTVERGLGSQADATKNERALAANQNSPQALRAAIAARLAESPGALRPTSVALVDVDRVRELNDRHGPKVIDRVLHRIVLDADRAVGDGGLLASEDPQRLLLLLSSPTPSAAVDAVEHLRQSVAATQYVNGDTQFSVSLSCGIAHALVGDTLESLLERATTTLQEAKRDGRNRTFTLDDKYPAPVAPPTLTIESRVITL